MAFSSPAAFNALIDHSKPGFPAKNPTQVLAVLTGPFTRLTNRLTALLRPSAEAMADRAFFEESTLLTLYAIAGSISALANDYNISPCCGKKFLRATASSLSFIGSYWMSAVPFAACIATIQKLKKLDAPALLRSQRLKLTEGLREAGKA